MEIRRNIRIINLIGQSNMIKEKVGEKTRNQDAVLNSTFRVHFTFVLFRSLIFVILYLKLENVFVELFNKTLTNIITHIYKNQSK